MMKTKMPATPIWPTQLLKFLSQFPTGKSLIARNRAMMIATRAISRAIAFFSLPEGIAATSFRAKSKNPGTQSMGNCTGCLDFARHDKHEKSAPAHLHARAYSHVKNFFAVGVRRVLLYLSPALRASSANVG